jgi:cation diffusion facilitator CzcD-associated flavoprotein CzcO
MTWAVVGAGYTGIAAAAAMIDAGLDVDVLDARPGVGGLWLDGVYDSVRLITTRKVTAFRGRPMPDGDLFPTGAEMLAYLTQVADDTGVTKRLVNHRVGAITQNGAGWFVDQRPYDGVVLATGLFQQPRIPDLPGALTVPALHTRDYRSPDQLGDDVLVVGLGNSGADVAQDAVKAGKRVTMAVRRSRHVVPKRVLGLPVVEMHRPAHVPDLPVRLALDVATRALSLYWRRGRLGEPRHLVLSESPVVHSAILPLIAGRKVQIRSAVASLDGADVHFVDGSSATFDTVVWGTGYDYDLPVDRALVDGRSGSYRTRPPLLVGGAWSPVSRGLAVVGHREPRHGRGPYLSAVAELVAAGALAQSRCAEPVGAALSAVAPPDATALADDGPELRRIARLTEAALAL